MHYSIESSSRVQLDSTHQQRGMELEVAVARANAASNFDVQSRIRAVEYDAKAAFSQQQLALLNQLSAEDHQPLVRHKEFFFMRLRPSWSDETTPTRSTPTEWNVNYACMRYTLKDRPQNSNKLVQL